MSTTKNIKDYLHLYFGCACVRPDGKTILNVDGIFGTLVQHRENKQITYSSASGCRPILRPLSSMTEEEKMECDTQIHKCEHQLHSSITDWAYRIDWLLKHRFDLFNLIEEGLAIDVTKLQSNQNVQVSDTTKQSI
jgi:hypothetical protein